jgi:hypothetical protein
MEKRTKQLEDEASQPAAVRKANLKLIKEARKGKGKFVVLVPRSPKGD